MLIDFVFSTDVCTWMGWFAKDICIVVEDGIFYFFGGALIHCWDMC